MTMLGSSCVLRVSHLRLVACCMVSCGWGSIASTCITASEESKPTRPACSHADVPYGDHERHRLDVWLSEGNDVRPLMVFIHGGGWNSGDKADVPDKFLRFFLDQGVHVASINYRYTYMARIPAPLHDAARAIQFLRSKKDAWRIRDDRIGAYGVSAGGCSALWLAFHDDLSQASSPDPIARQSTRLQVAVGISPQTSLEVDVVEGWMGREVLNHPMIGRAIGIKNRDELHAKGREWRDMLRECSPIRHVSSDDPPAMVVYPRVDPLPAPNAGSAIHHARFGMELIEVANSAGGTCHLRIEESATADQLKPEAFLIQQLTRN